MNFSKTTFSIIVMALGLFTYSCKDNQLLGSERTTPEVNIKEIN